MRDLVEFGRPSWFSRYRSAALVGGALCLLPLAAQAENSSNESPRDIASSVVSQEQGIEEQSILVATSKAEPTADATQTVEAEEGLKPISLVAEKEPVLAPVRTPDSQATPIATITDEVPLRVAANTTDLPSESAASKAPQATLFRGIQPGKSTKEDLLEGWGEPSEVTPTDSGELLSYKPKSFRRVDVLIEEGVVSLMKITLRQSMSPAELAQKVQVDPADAVDLKNDQTGQILGYAYPEQGIVLVIDTPTKLAQIDSVDSAVDSADLADETEATDQAALPKEKTPKEKTASSEAQVSQMLLQPLDADTFCLRAKQRPRYDYTGRIADLQKATALDPSESYAHWLLAEVLLQADKAGPAEAAASRAVALSPENIAYRQLWGQTLAAVGKYDTALLKTREVLDDENAPAIIRARALHQMGLLAAMGDSNVTAKAIKFHNMAIQQADSLATSNNRLLRCEAKRLLVEAHLEIALNLSRRDYKDRFEKLDSVATWVSRASGFAEEAIENDQADLGLRVRVAQQSLAALANFKPANDPDPLLQEIEETMELIREQSNDPLWIDQLDWATGIAYLRALQIEHHRRHPERALDYSKRAVELLGDRAEERRDNPQTELLVGQLYFHIGALHAVHQQEHAKAVEWYDRAYPLLTAEIPGSEFTVPRREGEALVSMAVSYWDQGEKDRAVSLTEEGAKLIQKAIKGGVVEQSTLAVPYGNLAVMHKSLGNRSESIRFAKLAKNMEKANSEKATAQAEENRKPAEVAAQPMPRTTAKPMPSKTNSKQVTRSAKGSPKPSQVAKEQPARSRHHRTASGYKRRGSSYR